MRDIIDEVLASMQSNKTRIALTGFSIGWGIFILIVLLGAGNGLLKGMMSNFSDATDNIYTITPGRTTLLHAGHERGRIISFTPEDTVWISNTFPQQVTQIAVALSDTTHLAFGKVNTQATIDGQTLGFEKVEHIKVIEGRLLNATDLESMRKVCVISESIADVLFRNVKQRVGQTILVGKVPFLVIGIYSPNMDIGGTIRTVYAPYTTVQKLFCNDNKLSKISLITRSLDDMSSNRAFETQLRNGLARMKEYSPADQTAINLSSDYEAYLNTINILNGIYLFIILIGLATLVSGVVGVSNIMLIAVKERTRELGVRKAMGASNEYIVTLVILESVIITIVFGYIGMILGVGLTQLLSSALSAMGGSGIFGAPTVGLGVIFAANAVMVLAGIIAGYVPAKKAISCKLVDALSA